MAGIILSNGLCVTYGRERGSAGSPLAQNLFNINLKQAGAELCQAQVKLGLAKPATAKI